MPIKTKNNIYVVKILMSIFSMFKRIYFKILKEQNIFLLSNVIFSASTYLVMLFIPYLLTLHTMAAFSSTYNALMLLLFVFEFGISMSFLRFYQIYKIVFLLNTVLQITILIGLFIISLSPFGKMLIDLFHLGQSELNVPLFFVALISQLGWIYSKNVLLAERRYRYILGISISVLIFRIALLFYLFFLESLTINAILMTMFIIPFIPVFFILMISSYKIITSFGIKMDNIRINRVFFFYLQRFMKFSLMTYIIGILYVFAGRYLIIYLTEKNQLSLLADLGYAMTFLGIITIASTSFRTFFISKFHLGDMQSIQIHLDDYFSKIKPLVFGVLLIATILSIIVYMIMPSYLSINAPLFVFIMTASYGIIFLISLVTFLSKTMNYNKLEMQINIIRLIIVVVITRFLFLDYPLIGFLLINLVMLIGELIFSKMILYRLQYAR